MQRVLESARGRAGRVGLVAGVMVAALVGLSAPAFAHHSDASGRATTQPQVTTTTTYHCECTTTTQPEVTTTTTHHCGCSTTTTVPETTTTEQATTTTTEVHELGSTTIVTTTTKPKATTTLADGSSSTVATTTPVPGTLPFTGGNTNLPVIFGGLCIAAGAALAFRKRGAWSR